MECLLGVDALLGNGGGGENGSGSSSWYLGIGISSSCESVTQFPRGNKSCGFSDFGLAEGQSGSSLRTGEWCNFLGEILEESTGKCEIVSRCNAFGLGLGLPSDGSVFLLGGGGQENLLGSNGGFSATNSLR
jgi:hypothetical protein